MSSWATLIADVHLFWFFSFEFASVSECIFERPQSGELAVERLCPAPGVRCRGKPFPAVGRSRQQVQVEQRGQSARGGGGGLACTPRNAREIVFCCGRSGASGQCGRRFVGVVRTMFPSTGTRLSVSLGGTYACRVVVGDATVIQDKKFSWMDREVPRRVVPSKWGDRCWERRGSSVWEHCLRSSDTEA